MSDVRPDIDPAYDDLHGTIVTLLLAARQRAARRVNALMTATYWEIGRRIVTLEQGGAERATYGEAVLERLARDLSARFGRGFSATNLKQMRAFHLAWPAARIGQTPSDESAASAADALELATERFPLPWSAYVALLAVKEEPARTFYEAEALSGGWSVRQLRRQIDSQFYQRTALSRDKAAMLRQGGAPIDADRVLAFTLFCDPRA